MKKTHSRVNKAMKETVDLDGLNEKILHKYLKFLQTKSLTPLTQQNRDNPDTKRTNNNNTNADRKQTQNEMQADYR